MAKGTTQDFLQQKSNPREINMADMLYLKVLATGVTVTELAAQTMLSALTQTCFAQRTGQHQDTFY